MNDIERAIIIAVNAHQGQKEKAGTPYVFHPLGLMLKQNSQEARIVAVLHDVVEDTDINLAYLAEAGFSDSVLCAIELLTHDKNTEYMDYIEALSHNSIAKSVKLADLADNLDISRIPNPTEKDYQRLEKYKKAYKFLMDADKESM